MLGNIFSNINVAKGKLSRLGMSLFYLYLVLILAGCAGMVFGPINIILKLLNIGTAAITPWWELIAITVVSWLMIKIFLRESHNLINLDKVMERENPDEVIEQRPPSSDSTVVPFRRKSQDQDILK